MLSLNHIENATEEDKEWRIDEWARLFKATTWEEIKNISKCLPELEAAGREMYRMNALEKVRWECEQREMYERHERTMQRDLRLAREEKEAAEAEVAELRAEIERLKILVENK